MAAKVQATSSKRHHTIAHHATDHQAAPKEFKPVKNHDTVSMTAVAKGDKRSGTRTYLGETYFETGKNTLGHSKKAALLKMLDAFAGDFKKLPIERQKVLLSDPRFTIAVEGHASNLGNAQKFDNAKLAEARAHSTGQFVLEYLKKRGIDVPARAVLAAGKGAPGSAKKPDNNDPADRSASVEIRMPVGESGGKPIVQPMPGGLPKPGDLTAGPVQSEPAEGAASHGAPALTSVGPSLEPAKPPAPPRPEIPELHSTNSPKPEQPETIPELRATRPQGPELPEIPELRATRPADRPVQTGGNPDQYSALPPQVPDAIP